LVVSNITTTIAQPGQEYISHCIPTNNNPINNGHPYPHPMNPRICGGERKEERRSICKERYTMESIGEGYVHIHHLYQKIGQRKGNGYMEEEIAIDKHRWILPWVTKQKHPPSYMTPPIKETDIKHHSNEN
jgi:hypothetical protein